MNSCSKVIILAKEKVRSRIIINSQNRSRIKMMQLWFLSFGYGFVFCSWKRKMNNRSGINFCSKDIVVTPKGQHYWAASIIPSRNRNRIRMMRLWFLSVGNMAVYLYIGQKFVGKMNPPRNTCCPIVDSKIFLESSSHKLSNLLLLKNYVWKPKLTQGVQLTL
jgi:hypothetical protein